MPNIQEILQNFNIEGFQHDLLSWFEHEQRDLPWRKDQDPYKIWVSEIMLQQTKVEAVKPYFTTFMERFPTIQALANADEQDVLKTWEGLGYYSRARNLHSAVKEVVEKYEGKVPSNPKEISTLKGVGPYTQGAILSIAYNQPEPAVDGNVMRVMSRILLVKEDIMQVKTRKLFEKIITNIISEKNPSFFNQGLMELGALICIPKKPACLLCPVQEHCRALKEGMQYELPIRKAKKKQKTVTIIAAILKSEDGKILIRKRPNEGLLANMWEFPNYSYVLDDIAPPTMQFMNNLETDLAFKSEIHDQLALITHEFSHLIWHIQVYEGVVKQHGDLSKRDDVALVTLEQLSNYPFSVAHQKIIKSYIEKRNQEV
ncbi:A/G-specific adenine glycosylase [Bacillus sp. HMF5848]|uniref:A/G-specific adenine glycosylase n=1 Tax=Bacillus sp. HMF5848 TaxID=2495421 RepID=UPI000F78D843|nr:A/G-specific adenine glycosylase [Bacillus sp. HMF5848]RSK26148.1 A/G-specific adenine glycosylase [Bacillus sp. HMF5848]